MAQEWISVKDRLPSVEDGIVQVRLISDAPTIDAVPVVHGRWTYDAQKDKAVCSCCGSVINACYGDKDFCFIAAHEHFCYNCGAKMDLEDKNGV